VKASEFTKGPEPQWFQSGFQPVPQSTHIARFLNRTIQASTMASRDEMENFPPVITPTPFTAPHGGAPQPSAHCPPGAYPTNQGHPVVYGTSDFHALEVY